MLSGNTLCSTCLFTVVKGIVRGLWSKCLYPHLSSCSWVTQAHQCNKSRLCCSGQVLRLCMYIQCATQLTLLQTSEVHLASFLVTCWCLRLCQVYNNKHIANSRYPPAKTLKTDYYMYRFSCKKLCKLWSNCKRCQ